ncbi:unnamed protein product [Tuber melanosporum]|uniref:(Perigord truffle) hypothetical protein n=1 Tax=Tuber melanosporum (strain Mel28) TaxID=656061 RepID=D5G9W7_TUBMM|nr:uncharacterized protein GSTUM_00005106001 [Tuber melanosporum]CAZ81310.1 unnamed protein product [Tuber melanosporum]
MARPGKEKAIAPAVIDIDELRRKRDAFVTAMTLLRNAADEASRTGLAFFDIFIGSGTEQPSQIALQRSTTEEPEGPKKRAKRAKRDPAMPKRPMTAYLLFCHQGRDTVKADLGPNATHKDILAELTKRWSETPEDQKKAWQDLYQKNREVYAKDMALYKATKAPQAGESSATFTPVNAELEDVQESEAESDRAELTAEDVEEDEEEEEELEEEPEEDVRSPTPPPRKRGTPRSKKAAATNGNLKKALNSIAVSGTSTAAAPAVVGAKAKAEPTKRKRAGRKKVVEVEEEEASDEVTPKKKAPRKRRKSSD